MHQRFISDQDPALHGFVDATFRITIVFCCCAVLFCFAFLSVLAVRIKKNLINCAKNVGYSDY